GAICLISFLEHFSANPAYRPSFTSRWYFSLPGAILCIWLMFQMNLPYAIGSVILMVAIYFWVSRYNDHNGGMARIFQGVIFQISRSLRVTLQKTILEDDYEDEFWVPSVICVSQTSFDRLADFDMVRFISHKYGFGTFIHMIKEYYSKNTVHRSKEVQRRLLQRTKVSRSNVYVDTLISPSYTTAVAQTLQLPGISGRENNMILFEFSRNSPDGIQDVVENLGLINAGAFDLCVLRSSEKGFGYKQYIHVWLTIDDFVNGNLMILLAYIISGHPEWKGSEIKIFAIYPADQLEEQRTKLLKLIDSGRLAISLNNVEVISREEDRSLKSFINEKSSDADLTIMGFRKERLKKDAAETFGGLSHCGNILYVSSNQEKKIY
ncbi:MAG: amino acid permease, partial [Bacteroidota bacterium]